MSHHILRHCCRASDVSEATSTQLRTKEGVIKSTYLVELQILVFTRNYDNKPTNDLVLPVCF